MSVLKERGGRELSRSEGLLKPGYLLPCAGQLDKKKEGNFIHTNPSAAFIVIHSYERTKDLHRHKKHFSACVRVTAHLREPKKIMGDGGGAALDLNQRDLVFSCHQDVVFLVEHGGQVHTSDGNDATHKQ